MHPVLAAGFCLGMLLRAGAEVSAKPWPAAAAWGIDLVIAVIVPAVYSWVWRATDPQRRMLGLSLASCQRHH